MKYQLFSSIIVLFLLTINLSSTIGKSRVEFTNNDLSPTVTEDGIRPYQPKWRRQPKLVRSRSDTMNKEKARARILTYDFLLHKWFLRKTPN